MKFAVIGGDMRQVKLAELLAADGHEIKTFGFGEEIVPGTRVCVTAEEAMRDTEYIILPLPAATTDGYINLPLSGEHISVDDVIPAVSSGQIVFAGRAAGALKSSAEKHGKKLIDYFEREELTVKNAEATAEGAVQILMEELPITLQKTKCLIIGFGRIGKFLGLKLRALGADVTVSARRFSDMAWIECLGMKSADTRRLLPVLCEFDAVINTVPARILDKKHLENIKNGALCLDLASNPGGIDFEAASELNVRAVWALSLPGRVAPVTSGEAIKDTIYNIITELECAD